MVPVCRKIAENFNVGKTVTATILKEEKRLRKVFEFFSGDRKKRKYGQYHTINKIVFAWYKNCASANVFPGGPILIKEVMLIKKQLNNTDFEHFSASNG